MQGEVRQHVTAATRKAATAILCCDPCIRHLPSAVAVVLSHASLAACTVMKRVIADLCNGHVTCRWHNHLNPDINRSEWTREEDEQLVALHARCAE